MSAEPGASTPSSIPNRNAAVLSTPGRWAALEMGDLRSAAPAATVAARDRELDRHDKRVIHVGLTIKGRELIDGIIAGLTEKESDLLTPFSDASVKRSSTS